MSIPTMIGLIGYMSRKTFFAKCSVRPPLWDFTPKKNVRECKILNYFVQTSRISSDMSEIYVFEYLVKMPLCTAYPPILVRMRMAAEHVFWVAFVRPLRHNTKISFFLACMLFLKTSMNKAFSGVNNMM